MAADAARQPARAIPLWRNVSFTLMWTSSAASGFGDRMMMLAALALLGGMGQDIDSTSVLAATQFWFLLPYILFSVSGGWLADHLPRKWIMLACDETRALILLVSFVLAAQTMPGSASIPGDRHWQVYAALFLVGTCATFFAPSRNAIVPQIVPLRQLQPANAVILGITVIASIIGMLIGGRIIEPTDAPSVRDGLLFAVLLYGVSGLFFAFLRPAQRIAPARAAARGRSFAQTLHYVMCHRRIGILIGVNIAVWAAAQVVFNAGLALAKLQYGFLDEPDAERLIFDTFTQLGAAIGAGMLFGAVALIVIRTRRESDAVLGITLALAGLCTLLLAIVPDYELGLLFGFGVGFFGNITIVSITSLLQSVSPNYIRGRVMGLNNTLNTVSSVLVNLVIWKLPNTDSLLIWALLVLGTGLIVVGVAALWRQLGRGPLPSPLANALWRMLRLYTLVWHRVHWVGKHRVPHAGAVILAPNHTTGLDPFVVQAATPRLVRWIMLTSYQFRALGPLWRAAQPIALDRDTGDLAKIRQVVNALKAGEAVGLFPEGSLQRGNRVLGAFEPGVGMIARRSGAPIVPVWIHGTPRMHHMVWHFLMPSRTLVIFGEPFTPSADAKPDEIAAQLRERMLELEAMVEQYASGPR